MDGSSFIAEQGRNGQGKPPSARRIVPNGGAPAVFSVHRATVVEPDGTVVERESWHLRQSVDRNHELVTCSFVIPGPLTVHEARFEGFFVPDGE